MQFLCKLCPYSSGDFKRLTFHHRHVHPLSDILCNINGCKSKYASIRAFIRHIKSKHFWFWEVNWNKKDCLDNDNSSILDQQEESDNDIGSNSVVVSEGEENVDLLNGSNAAANDEGIVTFDHEKLEEFIVSFLLELREEKKVSGVACEFVARKISALLDMIGVSQDSVLEQIKNSLEHLEGPHLRNFNESWRNVSTIVLKNLFDKYTNQKTFNAHIARQPFFVAPTEFQLNDNHPKIDTFQYVSLLKTLKIILSKEENQRFILNIPASEPSRLCNFRDGAIFNKSEFWRSSSEHIQIFLYFDDFNCSNPLGNKVKKCKLSAFYFVIGNFPRKKRSELTSINLLLLCKSKYIENYGYAPVLEPLLNDLLELEEKGINICVDGVVKTFYGSLALIIADNLAQHGIGGFFENFSKTKRLCRCCMINREDIAKSFDENNYLKRTVESYNLHIEAISENPELGKIYGMKQGCEFNKLNYFNLIGQQPFDLHHDFFEGVAVDVLSETIKRFVSDGFFTLEDFNNALQNFEYASCDKKDKPQPVNISGSLSALKIKATAIEMSNLLRLLPMLIGDYIPEENDVWALYLNFIKIVELILAPSLHRGEVLHLRDLIEEFFENYIIVFPDVTIKPKCHYISHYPSQILNLGPASDHATIRFEAKHNFFKSIYNRSNNTINIAKSLAFRHQYFMYLHSKKNLSKDDNVEFVGGAEIPIVLLDANIQQKVYAIESSAQPVIFQGKSLFIDGQSYNSDLAVLIGHENDEYVFARIESAFNISEIYYLCVRKLQTICFNLHYNAYEVKDTSEIDLKRVEELLDYHPLGIYNVRGVSASLIPLRHFISLSDD